LHGIIIDRADAAEVERIAALGMAVLVTETVMGELDDRRRLAAEVMRFTSELHERAAGACR
jgi:hypothetical protein